MPTSEFNVAEAAIALEVILAIAELLFKSAPASPATAAPEIVTFKELAPGLERFNITTTS